MKMTSYLIFSKMPKEEVSKVKVNHSKLGKPIRFKVNHLRLIKICKELQLPYNLKLLSLLTKQRFKINKLHSNKTLQANKNYQAWMFNQLLSEESQPIKHNNKMRKWIQPFNNNNNNRFNMYHRWIWWMLALWDPLTLGVHCLLNRWILK